MSKKQEYKHAVQLDGPPYDSFLAELFKLINNAKGQEAYQYFTKHWRHVLGMVTMEGEKTIVYQKLFNYVTSVSSQLHRGAVAGMEYQVLSPQDFPFSLDMPGQKPVAPQASAAAQPGPSNAYHPPPSQPQQSQRPSMPPQQQQPGWPQYAPYAPPPPHQSVAPPPAASQAYNPYNPPPSQSSHVPSYGYSQPPQQAQPPPQQQQQQWGGAPLYQQQQPSASAARPMSTQPSHPPPQYQARGPPPSQSSAPVYQQPSYSSNPSVVPPPEAQRPYIAPSSKPPAPSPAPVSAPPPPFHKPYAPEHAKWSFSSQADATSYKKSIMLQRSRIQEAMDELSKLWRVLEEEERRADEFLLR